MTDRSKKFYGFYIHPDIQVDIAQRRIINLSLSNERHEENNNIRIIKLRKTMMRLFVYLLENANGTVITNDKILHEVWDKHELSSSAQRLWRVMKSLRQHLVSVGISEDFITRIEGKGYCIQNNQITHLYYEERICRPSTNDAT